MTDVLTPPAPETRTAPPPANLPSDARRRSRLTSLDLLRGLAVGLMVLVNVPGDHSLHPGPLVHVRWEGFGLAEVVFPAFVVASGGALALSSRSSSLRATFIRAARIFAVGLLIIWWKYGEIGLRSGTLQFIAVSWLVAALLYRLPARWRVPAALLLVGVVAALHEIPALPGSSGWGVTDIDAHIDAPIFGDRSDLGLLGMLSAGSIGALAAVVVGSVRSSSHRRRVAVFAAVALAAAGSAAVLVRLGVPMVKRTWSPSYLLAGAAASAAVLAVGEAIAATRARALLTPFLALGTNALPLYVLSSAVAITWTSEERESATAWLVDRGLGPAMASASISLGVLAVLFALAMWLRRTGRVIRL